MPAFAGRTKVKILERAETMGDVLHAPNGIGKRYASIQEPVTFVLPSVPGNFPGTACSARNHDWIQTDRVLSPYGQ